jgi:hypothetical protein
VRQRLRVKVMRVDQVHLVEVKVHIMVQVEVEVPEQ